MFSPPEGVPTADFNPSLSLPRPDAKKALGLFAVTALAALSFHGGLKQSSSETVSETIGSHLVHNSTSAYESLGAEKTHKKFKQSINEQKEQKKNQATDNDLNNEGSNYSFGEDTLLKVSAKFTLNKEQHPVFMKIGRTLFLELAEQNRSTVPQLLAYIGGPGGTGKSQVIKAIQHLFMHCGKNTWLRSASYTGTAASNINGSTISSLTGDRKKKKRQTKRWSKRQ